MSYRVWWHSSAGFSIKSTVVVLGVINSHWRGSLTTKSVQIGLDLRDLGGSNPRRRLQVEPMLAKSPRQLSNPY